MKPITLLYVAIVVSVIAGAIGTGAGSIEGCLNHSCIRLGRSF